MIDNDGDLNYLEVLAWLAGKEGRRVQFAIFERRSVTPLAVFWGVLGPPGDEHR